MAAPTFVGVQANSGLTSTLSCAAPAGTQAGDFQVVFCTGGTSSETWGAVPSGWTQVVADLATTASTTGTYLVRILYSTTAGTASFSMTKSGTRAWTVVRASYRGTKGLLAGSGKLAMNTASTTHAWQTQTPPQADSFVIGGAVGDFQDAGGGSISGVPASTNNRYNQTLTSEFMAVALVDRVTTSNNQLVSGNFTTSASNCVSTWSLTIEPAGTSAPAENATGTGTANDATVDIVSPYPRVKAVATSNSTANGTSHSVTLPPAEAGDLLLAFFTNDCTTTTATATPNAAQGWTTLGTALNGTVVRHSVFYKTATGSDALTVTTSASEASSRVVFAISGQTGPPEISAAATGTTANPDTAAITTAQPLGYAYKFFSAVGLDSAVNLTTGPSGYPTTYQNASTGTSTDLCSTFVATRDAQTTSEDPGTFTASISEQWVGFTVAVPGNPIDIDAPAGNAGATGTANDPTPGILEDLPDLSDSGTGTDVIDVQQYEGRNLTDSGAATDTAVVDQFQFWTEDGTGDDTTTLLSTTLVTETGAGTDIIALQKYETLFETGVGTDTISILDIPFTQVLPPQRVRARYELVAVARIQQASGAPAFMEVDPIDWVDIQYTNTLSAPQELQASCLVSTLADSIIERIRDAAAQPMELWLYRDGDLVFAGPLVGGTVDEDVLKFSAKGILSYLDRMFVESDLIYKTTDQATIVKNLIDHFQAKDFGNYGIDTSSIVTTGVNRDVTYTKAGLHQIGKEVDELSKSSNGFDYDINPATRKISVYYPTKGTDRSTGEDAIVFDARNITSTSVMFALGQNDVATIAYGVGSAPSGSEQGNTYSTKSNTNLMATFGRSGITNSFSNVPNQSTLDNYVQSLLDARAAQLVLPGTDSLDTPDAEIGSFEVGDIVLYEPNPILMGAGAYRIRKIVVKVAESGKETVSLEFA